MKKLPQSKAGFVLIAFLIMCTSSILIVYSIPSLISAINFVNKVKYEIIGEYVDEYFIQKGIIWNISYNIFHTLTFALIIIFSVITMFKPKKIKLIGEVIIAQNVILLFLELWNQFLFNEMNNTILINIKLFLFLTILITIIIILVSLKQKIFYFILGIITIFRFVNTINLVAEYVASINNIQVIFLCFSEMLVLILYWIALIITKRNNKVSTEKGKN